MYLIDCSKTPGTGCPITQSFRFPLQQHNTNKMEAMQRLFGAARSPPPRVETDDIYPVHMLDDTKTLRGIVVTWTLRFDDVLDPVKLHKSLLQLLEMGDWRKIGGRLRMKVVDHLIYI